MTGLILKDLYTMKKTLIYLVAVVVLFTAIYSSAGDSYFSDFFVSIMVVSILISTMSYDEFYHWDRYAAILPLSRRRIVGAKYLTALLFFGMGGLISLGISVAVQLFQGRGFFMDDLALVAIGPLVGMLGAAVILPCYYRFGAQKSRFVMLAFYGIPSILLVLALKFAPESLNNVPEIEITPAGIALAGVALTAAAMVVSFLVSVRILERKELK
ncbi:MAG: ABC-2 transporter permease [Angelakisella sp.]|jgi:ABC-2 type transport system permease protein|nr:ABC-2 transporter permease [Angelakisella sp.]